MPAVRWAVAASPGPVDAVAAPCRLRSEPVADVAAEGEIQRVLQRVLEDQPRGRRRREAERAR
jgi:hypothetical protein